MVRLPKGIIVPSDVQRSECFQHYGHTGLLPRDDYPGQHFPMFADHFEVIDRDAWPELIGKIDLDRRQRLAFSQRSVGSCASEACTRTIESIRDEQNEPYVRLNPYGLYAHACGGRDAGSSLPANLRFARDLGVPPIDLWPREKGWRTKPYGEAAEVAKQFRIIEAWEIGTWDEFVTAILKKFPVECGYPGHAITAYRVLGNLRSFDYWNSWSKTWGRNGRGTLDMRDLQWNYGFFAVRVATEATYVQDSRYWIAA